MNINDVQLPQPETNQTPFLDWWKETFGIDIEGEETTYQTEYQGRTLNIQGFYRHTSGWSFSINGNNFSTRGDLMSLPIDDRRRHLVEFIRKVV